MTETKVMYFLKEENQALFRKAYSGLDTLQSLDEFSTGLVSCLRAFLEVVFNHPSVLDASCAFNIDWIGKRFIENIVEFNGVTSSRKVELLSPIFAQAYRFVCEFDLAVPEDQRWDRKLTCQVDN